MSLIKGLAQIKKNQEEQAARAAERDKPKVAWLSSVFPKKTGDVVNVRFLQELDPDMTNYDEARGVGFIAVEHNAPGPDGFKYRGKCTGDEGACYACERHRLDYKEGWKPKQNLYINVALEFEGKPQVFVLSRNANSTFIQSLIQEAIDEGSITDSMYRITKTGTGTQTQWIPKRLPKEPLLDDSGLTLFNIDEAVIRNIAYDEQPKYYGQAAGVSVDSDGDSSEGGATKPPVDEEW